MSAPSVPTEARGGTSTRHRPPRRTGLRVAGIGAGLVVAFVVLRAPTAASHLTNWDSVNFALGVESFDLEHHQPHPPGYAGYLLLARFVRWLTGAGSPATLSAISVVSGAAAPALLFVLAARVASVRAAAGAAVLFGTTPLVWYYGAVALSYMVGAAVALAVVGACHVARRECSRRHLHLAIVLLVLLGALRQTDILLLAPLVVYAARVFPVREQIRGLALVVALSLSWAVPLVWSTGGIGAYVELSADLAELTGGQTSLLTGGVLGLARNVLLFGLGLVFGLAVFGFLWWRARRWGVPTWSGLDRTDRRFLLVWITPSVFTFLFIHTGQLGYVLVVVPAFYVLAALGLDGLLRRARASTAGRPRPVLLVAALVLANVLVYVAAPDLAVSIARAQTPEGAGSGHRVSVLERTREFNVPLNDAHWRSVQETVRAFDPDTTLLLAMPHSAGSFRHLGYYLPQYRVYGVGRDRDGRFGHLFSSRDRESDYSVDGLERADRVVDLPPGTERVLVLDQPIRWRLEDVGTNAELSLDSGLSLLRVDLADTTRLWFRASDGEAVGLSGR